MNRYCLLFLFCFLSVFIVHSQTILPIPTSDPVMSRKSPPIQHIFNEITYSDELWSVFKKMVELKKGQRDRFTVVHIGDSHLQAGSQAAAVRKSLQSYFGSSGRGLVFPYRLAKSNSPLDLVGTSNVSWEFNRIAHPEINTLSGISGFMIHTQKPKPSIDFSLIRDENDSNIPFDLVRIYTEPSDSVAWTFRSGSVVMRFLSSDSSSITVPLDTPRFDFTLTGDSSEKTKTVYGFSLESRNRGLIYHSIGVNGARYSQYNISPHFWDQLPSLNGDLYIISLGTNEAQNTVFDEVAFYASVDTMVKRLRKITPDAGVVLATAQDSYRLGKSNQNIRKVNEQLRAYAHAEKVPLWDLYKVTNGYKSCYYWNSLGYMTKDRIHFTADMYRIQGQLLFNAIAKAFNLYLRSIQN